VQRLPITGPPLAGASRIRRRHQADICQGIGIFLPFDDEDPISSCDSGKDFRQPVENALDALQVPDPPIRTVGPPADESLRPLAYDLVDDLAGVISVGVDRDDVRASDRLARLPRIDQAKAPRQILPIPASFTGVTDPGALPRVPTRRWVCVVVRWAEEPDLAALASTMPREGRSIQIEMGGLEGHEVLGLGR
jgi:hypothetical protein